MCKRAGTQLSHTAMQYHCIRPVGIDPGAETNLWHLQNWMRQLQGRVCLMSSSTGSLSCKASTSSLKQVATPTHHMQRHAEFLGTLVEYMAILTPRSAIQGTGCMFSGEVNCSKAADCYTSGMNPWVSEAGFRTLCAALRKHLRGMFMVSYACRPPVACAGAAALFCDAGQRGDSHPHLHWRPAQRHGGGYRGAPDLACHAIPAAMLRDGDTGKWLHIHLSILIMPCNQA